MSFLSDKLNDLKHEDPERRAQATQALWKIWYQEAGEPAEKEIHIGVALMESDNLLLAEKHFLRMVEIYPDFGEAHNKLATVQYMLGKYSAAIESCEKVTLANPHHFGAWNGAGLCKFQLGQFDEAIACFQNALDIQPYAEANSHYIARCRGNLN